MCNSKTIILPIILLAFLLAACSKSDDQKQFENEAFSQPQDYTAMSANGQMDGSGQTDPDDWRIAPMYQGLIDVETPAYPNPVVLNNQIRLLLLIGGLESVNRIDAYAFRKNSSKMILIREFSQSLDQGYKVLDLNTSSFTHTGYRDGLFRLVLFDGRNNVITYGDIMVE